MIHAETAQVCEAFRVVDFVTTLGEELFIRCVFARVPRVLFVAILEERGIVDVPPDHILGSQYEHGGLVTVFVREQGMQHQVDGTEGCHPGNHVETVFLGRGLELVADTRVVLDQLLDGEDSLVTTETNTLTRTVLEDLTAHFVEPVFDEKKGCYHISWESFVYLIEGIVLKDRKVAFNDLNDENDEELGMDIEEPAQGKIDEKELLKEAV